MEIHLVWDVSFLLKCQGCCRHTGYADGRGSHGWRGHRNGPSFSPPQSEPCTELAARPPLTPEGFSSVPSQARECVGAPALRGGRWLCYAVHQVSLQNLPAPRMEYCHRSSLDFNTASNDKHLLTLHRAWATRSVRVFICKMFICSPLSSNWGWSHVITCTH